MNMLYAMTTLGIIIFGFSAFNRLGYLENKVAELEAKLKALMANKGDNTNEGVDMPAPYTKPASNAKPIAQPTPSNVEASQKRTDETSLPPKGTLSPWQTRAQKSEHIRRSTNSLDAVESDLSTRWMIWLGGITLALGGAFMVKYSIEAGLLKPAVRVSLGGLMGLSFIGFGEWFRQKRSDEGFMSDSPDYLPSAITAAGFASAFAAIYAAFALYDLIPALLAFTGMAALSLAITFMSVLHGRYFAYLGMIGGMIVPLLVSTGGGNAWTLFPYILTITAGAIWVSRHKQWVHLAATTLISAWLWSVIWIFANYNSGDILPMSLFVAALAYINATMLSGASAERSTEATLNGLYPHHSITFASDAATLGMVLVMVSLVRLEHYSTLALMLAGMAFAGQVFAVRKSPEHDMAGLFSVGGVLLLLATWHVPDIIELRNSLATNSPSFLPWSPLAEPGLEKFLGVSLFSSLLVGGLTFWQIPSLLRKGMWASVGTAFPLLALAIAYWRIEKLETSLDFASTSMVLSFLFAAAVTRLVKKGRDTHQTAIAAYATGASLALALALAMMLRDSWLSFALAIEVVAIAFIWSSTAVNGLRRVALVFALIVLARLFLNPHIVDYGPERLPLLLNWLFYGYLLTSALFFAAAKLFESHEIKDRLVPALKACAGLAFIAYITLETRIIFGKEQNLTGEATALEMAMHAVAWSAASAFLMWRGLKDNEPIFHILRRGMTGISIISLIFFGGSIVTLLDDEVAPRLIFNLQLLMFFIPSSIYALKAWMASKAGRKTSQKLYGAIAFFGYWGWASLEVRNAFHPEGVRASLNAGWEMYSYSAAWLVYALVLLFAGLKLTISHVRLAGLVVLGSVVLKVFLIDMSNLEGMERALSFIGLGLSLIGISYIYQKMRVSTARPVED